MIIPQTQIHIPIITIIFNNFFVQYFQWFHLLFLYNTFFDFIQQSSTRIITITTIAIIVSISISICEGI